ncbi:MAG: efflux RND transporter periplasmic adaptor subunit [Planctomycetes bacterium]|nr:efflux RND transporter periplasmic adaptor subunit [Planctomycetota bacterium]
MRRWLLAGAVALGFGAVVTSVLSSLGAFDRFLGGRLVGGTFYVVEPANLHITLTEDGELKPRHSIELKCEVEGQSTIRTVVDESTRVKKGALLVELASDAIQERLEQEEMQQRKLLAALTAAAEERDITQKENESNVEKAKIDLQVAELELEKYIKGDYEAAKQNIEINIEQTERDIERKQEDLDKNIPLNEKGFVPATKIKDLRFELERARMTLKQHQLSMLILENYDKPKALKQKESAVERAREELDRVQQRAASRAVQTEAKVEEQGELLKMCEKRLRRLREQLAKCRILAPVDGIVQYPSDGWSWRSDNQIAPGERVYEGQTLIVLPDTSQMIVTTRIHEADRHKVSEGMDCVVNVPAVPGQSFTGKISRIAKFADSAHRWLNPELKEHTAEILLDETDAPLSPGDSAEVKVLIEDVQNVLAVPVQCVFTRGSRSFVFAQRGGDIEAVEVELGRSSTTMVEAVKNLSLNDNVLMHVGEELLAKLPAPGAAPEMPLPQPVHASTAEPQDESASAVTAEDESRANTGQVAEGEAGEATAGQNQSATGTEVAESSDVKGDQKAQPKAAPEQAVNEKKDENADT